MLEIDESSQERLQATQKVTVIGAALNFLLAIGKTLFGFIAQSHALIADGIHSLSDLLSDALVYFAAKHAHQAPDSDHPYGHGRFETAATMGLGIILLLVAVGIGWDAAHRLFEPDELLQPTTLAIYVAILSVAVKELLYHYTMHVAKRINSEMLRANAWHHRSDSVSSVVVVVGVGGTLAGLPYLDAIAAIGVGLMIAHVGWEIGWPAFQELVDAGLEEERVALIRKTIFDVGGVQEIHMLRTRKMGGQASVDVHVLVDPWLSVSEGHMISQMVMERLMEEIEEVVDVTVHIDPEDDEVAAPSKGLPLRNRAEEDLDSCWADIEQAGRRQRTILHYLDGKVDVDVYFDYADYQDPQQAKALQEALQSALGRKPEFGTIKVFFGRTH
ncbi:cation diffusion facilitator family transporter [Solemya velesiana gill symbiont]|uniref:Cation transporter n=1 Tax=Solemya velesiana gill symbiont TaxID=1918948 RepID=A0A1T2KRW1_9GAMM|nr:cation diffusion facilitator family transporter [Solemya velesiana gill symbiont]OOZ35604.1 cation transporter [Solemya velesiana gill symbiont]